jgi:hypothetical protein
MALKSEINLAFIFDLFGDTLTRVLRLIQNHLVGNLMGKLTFLECQVSSFNACFNRSDLSLDLVTERKK